jgi:membrane associated rhomboid family serine protease
MPAASLARPAAENSKQIHAPRGIGLDIPAAVTTIIAVLVILGVIYRALSPEERARFFAYVVAVLKRVGRSIRLEGARLWAAIREKPAAFVTPSIAAVNAAVFVCMLFGRGSLSNPATLLAWGASYGPRTTNGEWWRLVTASFIHGGFIVWIVNTIALLEVGVVLERRVGGFALWTTYAVAALLANVVNLWTDPLLATNGSSGGVCGLYGLLAAFVVTARTDDPDGTITVRAIRRLIPMTAGVLVVNVLDTGVGNAAELAGAVVGLVLGFFVFRNVEAGQSLRRARLVLAGALILAAIAAAPLRGIVDVRPEIQRLLDLEQRTTKAYEASYSTFRKNGIDVDALARVIEGTIVPALEEADVRVKSLRGVPSEETWRIADAREYLRLREESWSLRARGLRETNAPVRSTGRTTASSGTLSSADAAARYRSSLMILGKADARERVALQVLDRIKIV